MTAAVRTARNPASQQAPVPGVKNVIAVGAGKGGVGKTTVAVNLAVALARLGSRVGIVDGDIYGPNVPIMLGLDSPLATEDEKILPAEQYGLKVVSMGFLTNDDSPVIWRGPMLHSVIQQFFHDVKWGELDYLVDRHAAGDRRRGPQPQPDRPGGRRHRRHHAAAGVARRQPPRGADVPEAEHPGARPHREHELLRLPELRARERHLRPRRRRADRERDAGARSSGASRSTSRSARAATRGVPLVVEEPDSPAAQAFTKAAEQAAAQVSIASPTASP